MVKFNKVNLKYLSQESSLRFDFNYLSYSKSKPKNYYKFYELFEEIDNREIPIDKNVAMTGEITLRELFCQ